MQKSLYAGLIQRSGCIKQRGALRMKLPQMFDARDLRLGADIGSGPKNEIPLSVGL